MNRNQRYPNFTGLVGKRPQAWATVRGSSAYPDILGTVRFYQTPYGVLVVSEIQGLPMRAGECGESIFGFHIHEGNSCSGNAEDPFANAGMHWNPYGCPHPEHAGDLPPLFGAGGVAFSAVLINRFTVEEIIGRTVIVHSQADDFTTQPSGNSGSKMACGEIIAYR